MRSLEVPGVGESLSTDQTTTHIEETHSLKATTRSQDFQASASQWSNPWRKWGIHCQLSAAQRKLCLFIK